jgi:hypothetical protein
VHKADGEERRFKQSAKGMFYLDTKEVSGTTLVATVDDNKSKYTKRSYKQALLA